MNKQLQDVLVMSLILGHCVDFIHMSLLVFDYKEQDCTSSKVKMF